MQRLAIVITLALLVSGFSPQLTGSSAGPPGAAIYLKAATFRPTLGERPDIPPGLTASEPHAGHKADYLVQFSGPIRVEWRGALVGIGAEVLAYVPDFAFKVRMTPQQASQVRRLDSVAWSGLFHPAYKLSPDLVRDGTRLYAVQLERGADAGRVRAAVAGLGALILAHDGNVLRVAAEGTQLPALAHLLDVAWIQNFVFQETHNEYGAGMILGAGTANGNGYDGSTQIVAIADTGLGGGTASTAHVDIPSSRITAVYNWTASSSPLCYNVIADGAKDVASGHGTHVAGSVLSDGQADGRGTGTAPGASLVFQAVEDYVDYNRFFCPYTDGYYLVGIPGDFRGLFQQAYEDGARIHSDSWGHDAAGAYDVDSVNIDDFVWTHPDMTILTSAGNAGSDGDSDGIVDADSMGSPATAKNLIAVGATENDRLGDYACDTGLTYTDCDTTGGQNSLFTYGDAWPADFPADPIAGDASAGNAEQLAAFSSRGPTDDGRIKPDLVAPGTWVLSTYSDLYQQEYDTSPNPQTGGWQYDGWGFPFDAEYKYMGGTSMAAPLAAGGAAVVRDYYQKAHGHGASAALVKATMINSAVDLLDENNDGADDNDYPIPNHHEGWGRVDVAAATDGSYQFVDEGTGLGTGSSTTYPFAIGAAGQPLKVSLVWSDYPSTAAASVNLVNDLDLVVTSPGGAVYRGNVFGGGWSQTGGSADRTNNVENVYIQSAAAGTWTVEVRGYNVPNGPQPYALVVDGVFAAVDNAPTVNITSPAEGSTVSGATAAVEIEATDAEDVAGTLTVEWNVDGGAWQSATYDSGTGKYKASWDSTAVGDGAHTLNARAIDSAAQTGSDSNTVTVDNINDPPVATFTYTCTGLACGFDASSSYDPDGSIDSYAWDFGDGGTDTGVTASHPYGAAGTYTVVLTVTDDGGVTGTDTQDVTVSKQPTTMHVSDLDGNSTPAARGRWNASVTITIHDGSEGPVANAAVSGTWSDGANGGESCTTNDSGQCIVSKTNLKNNVTSVRFTVDNVTHASLAYSPGENDDPDGDSDGTSVVVYRDGPPANQPPVASFTYDCTDLTCDFDASGSSDPDGTIRSYAWDFGDGGTATVVTANHTYDSAGNYTVILTVTDDEDAIGTASQQVPVGVPPIAMHIGNLDDSSTPAPRGRWNASVTITVHDANENPLASATISGTWSGGANGGASCITDGYGQCDVFKTNLKSNAGPVTFAVVDVAHASGIYQAGANHDPDGDSDGTTIIVSAP